MSARRVGRRSAVSPWRVRALLLLAVSLGPATPGRTASVPGLPELPQPIAEVVAIRPFNVRRAFACRWCYERPEVTHGLLLTLRADPALLVPRQRAEPVLYVGDVVAEVLHRDPRRGRVLALVHGKRELGSATLWFGRPELPERVEAETVQVERRLAREAGIRPPGEAARRRARAAGGPALRVADRRELLRQALRGVD